MVSAVMCRDLQPKFDLMLDLCLDLLTSLLCKMDSFNQPLQFHDIRMLKNNNIINTDIPAV
jgi:hypothetical protein